MHESTYFCGNVFDKETLILITAHLWSWFWPMVSASLPTGLSLITSGAVTGGGGGSAKNSLGNSKETNASCLARKNLPQLISLARKLVPRSFHSASTFE